MSEPTNTGEGIVADADPEGWGKVNTVDPATIMDERVRCHGIVHREILIGKGRGIPESSAVMVILSRIARAIEG